MGHPKRTPETIKSILDLFYRPLREGEIQKDNRSSIIAKEVNRPVHVVDEIISDHLKKKTIEIQRRNGHIK